MRRLGVDPSRVAILEDREGALAAAIAAGAGTVLHVGAGMPGPGETAAVPDLRSVAWDGQLLVGVAAGE